MSNEKNGLYPAGQSTPVPVYFLLRVLSLWFGCEFKGFYKGAEGGGAGGMECESLENSDFEAKMRGVNTGDFEIICPAH